MRDLIEDSIALEKSIKERTDSIRDSLSLDTQEAQTKGTLLLAALINRINEYKENSRSEDLIKLDTINLYEAAFSHGFNSGVDAVKEQLAEQGIQEIMTEDLDE